MIKRANTPVNFFHIVCNQCGLEFFDHIVFRLKTTFFAQCEQNPRKLPAAFLRYIL